MNFNNICNFKCRMCGPHFSNAWIPDYNKMKVMGSYKGNITNNGQVWSQPKQQIDVDKFLDRTDHDDFAAPDLSQLRIKKNQNSAIDGLHVEDVKNLMKNMNFIHTP